MFLSLLVFVSMVPLAANCQCYTENKVLFYGPTTESYYQSVVSTLGYTVEVADTTTWSSMTADDFSRYNAIIFADPDSSSGLLNTYIVSICHCNSKR